MLQIDCPWCGARDEGEFSYGGEAHIVRPADPYSLSDEQWGDYLFNRSNVKGAHYEQWCHSHGCRRWFNALRDTVSYQIHATYKIGAEKPEPPSTPTPTPASTSTSTSPLSAAAHERS